MVQITAITFAAAALFAGANGGAVDAGLEARKNGHCPVGVVRACGWFLLNPETSSCITVKYQTTLNLDPRTNLWTRSTRPTLMAS
ncbi:hypothetical protein B0T26DRAFT_745233 [Lasiosphaeria miniovina]|uniref:Uncharacterized protein n=1 Tax=Lasiosphaeria miniovina TaxID=1954250 RepID=A0AA40BF96_9PEZI|nr:uncharacterized protein B0T26DRAFT_745233 [Lasiosphaeria miniovina]KAK0733152.1 hypothetical protein B0T26DRAFT_745233 [Lasiosphaeria miniovina]